MVITESDVLKDTTVAEFERGDAWIALKEEMLLYKYTFPNDEVTDDIRELSRVCSGWYGEEKTKQYR